MIPRIELKGRDLTFATDIGLKRFAEAVRRGMLDRFDYNSKRSHVIGCRGEAANCLVLGVRWPALVNEEGEPMCGVVGGIGLTSATVSRPELALYIKCWKDFVRAGEKVEVEKWLKRPSKIDAEQQDRRHRWRYTRVWAVDGCTFDLTGWITGMEAREFAPVEDPGQRGQPALIVHPLTREPFGQQSCLHDMTRLLAGPPAGVVQLFYERWYLGGACLAGPDCKCKWCNFPHRSHICGACNRWDSPMWGFLGVSNRGLKSGEPPKIEL
jgi:hypothetical protein